MSFCFPFSKKKKRRLSRQTPRATMAHGHMLEPWDRSDVSKRSNAFNCKSHIMLRHLLSIVRNFSQPSAVCLVTWPVELMPGFKLLAQLVHTVSLLNFRQQAPNLLPGSRLPCWLELSTGHNPASHPVQLPCPLFLRPNSLGERNEEKNTRNEWQRVRKSLPVFSAKLLSRLHLGLAACVQIRCKQVIQKIGRGLCPRN